MAAVASGIPPALILGTENFFKRKSKIQHPLYHYFLLQVLTVRTDHEFR